MTSHFTIENLTPTDWPNICTNNYNLSLSHANFFFPFFLRMEVVGGGRFLCQNIFNAHICNLRIEGSMYIIGFYSVFFQRINISKIKYIASGAIWTDIKLENKIFLIILCHNTEIIFQSSISDIRFRDIHNMRL